MPKVSVIMSTYREPLKWINVAVESILKQSLTDFEFIIVVDDPKNKLIIEYLEAIEDTRVVLLKNESNLGLVRSLNKALEVCKSDYIARMDADDISLPERLEKQVAFMKTHNCDLCGTWYEVFDDTHAIRISNPPQSATVCERVLRYESCVAHPSWMVCKKVYDALGGYRNMDAVEDYDFLVRAVKAGYKVGNVQRVLLKYRDNYNSISHKKSIAQELNKRFISEKYRKGYIVTEGEFESYKSSALYMKRVHELEENQSLQRQFMTQRNVFRKVLLAKKICMSKLFVTRKIERQFVKTLKKLDRLQNKRNNNRD